MKTTKYERTTAVSGWNYEKKVTIQEDRSDEKCTRTVTTEEVYVIDQEEYEKNMENHTEICYDPGRVYAYYLEDEN